MASFDLIRKAQTAGLWFIGVFMEGFIHDYEKWHGCGFDGTKAEYIRWFHEEYGKNLQYELSSTKTKCYAVMEIIEHHRVLDALNLIFYSSNEKVSWDAVESASSLLDKIITDTIVLP